ncbi:MAG: hypothetical protein V2A34_09105 [Lentisphaerota bacterium]
MTPLQAGRGKKEYESGHVDWRDDVPLQIHMTSRMTRMIFPHPGDQGQLFPRFWSARGHSWPVLCLEEIALTAKRRVAGSEIRAPARARVARAIQGGHGGRTMGDGDRERVARVA